MCGSIKIYPYLPQGRDFSLGPPPPHPSEKFQILGPLRSSHPQEFPIPSVWGEYGYFLELHNAKKQC